MRRLGARVGGRLVVLALLAGLASGCTSEDDPDATPSPTTSAESNPGGGGGGSSKPADAATTSPYLPVPDSIALTMQGADLGLGDRATVAWEPRKNVVGALEVKVIRLEHARIEALAAFRLEPFQRRSSVFYVRGSVHNVGKTDLAGVDIPLYAVDGSDRLIESTPFAATYKPCPSTPMPKAFKTGKKTPFCLLYFVPERGRLVTVSFRPTQEYDPITWTGPIEQLPPPKKPKS